MNTGAIHPGGIPPATRQRIAAREQELLAANAEAFTKLGMFKRARLKEALADQAFHEVTGCQRQTWLTSLSGTTGIN